MNETPDQTFARMHDEAVKNGKFKPAKKGTCKLLGPQIAASIQRIETAIRDHAGESTPATREAAAKWWKAVMAGDDYQMLMLESDVIKAWTATYKVTL